MTPTTLRTELLRHGYLLPRTAEEIRVFEEAAKSFPPPPHLSDDPFAFLKSPQRRVRFPLSPDASDTAAHLGMAARGETLSGDDVADILKRASDATKKPR